MHAGTPLRASIELSGEVLSVRVHDLCPDLPLRLYPRFPRSGNAAGNPDRAPGTFGLQTVSFLAREWGVTELPDAKIVWAQLPLAGAVTAATSEPFTQHPSPPPDRPDH